MHDNLVEYVKSQRADGFSDSEIRKALDKSGWDSALVDSVLAGDNGIVLPQLLPDIGGLLSTSMKVYQQHVGLFFVFGMLPQLVIMVFALIPYFMEMGGQTQLRDWFVGLIMNGRWDVLVTWGILLFILMIVLQFVGTIGIVSIVKNRDKQVSFTDVLNEGISLLFPAIGVSFFVWLVSFGGALLFIVPGVYFSIVLGLGMYILVSEGISGWNNLERSMYLLKGYFWSFFVRAIVMGLVIMLISFVVGLIVGLASSLSGVESLSEFSNVIVGGVTTPLNIIYIYLIYESLVKIKGKGKVDEYDNNWFMKVCAVLGGLGLLGIIAAASFYWSNSDLRSTIQESIMQDLEIRQDSDVHVEMNYEDTSMPEETGFQEDYGVRRDN